jgi:hypothetical protein
VVDATPRQQSRLVFDTVATMANISNPQTSHIPPTGILRNIQSSISKDKAASDPFGFVDNDIEKDVGVLGKRKHDFAVKPRPLGKDNDPQPDQPGPLIQRTPSPQEPLSSGEDEDLAEDGSYPLAETGDNRDPSQNKRRKIWSGYNREERQGLQQPLEAGTSYNEWPGRTKARDLDASGRGRFPSVERDVAFASGRKIRHRHSFSTICATIKHEEKWLGKPYPDERSFLAQQPDGTSSNARNPLNHSTAQKRQAKSILYRIICKSQTQKNHLAFLYEDDPDLARAGRTFSRHCNANRPVENIQAYLASHAGVAFVVMRNRFCSVDANQHIPDDAFHVPSSSMPQSGIRESIVITSESLQGALSKVATCPIDLVEGSAEKIEIHSPYRFLYHHRTLLREFPEPGQHMLQSEIASLLQYVEEQYGRDFLEAEALFDKSLVTLRYLPMLYRPNEVVLKRDKRRQPDTLTAVVVDGWPGTFVRGLRIQSWSWNYNGWTFERRYLDYITLHSTYSQEDEATPIDQLEYIPLRFANAAIVSKLRERGLAFWRLRNRSHVAYTGRAEGSQKDHVSIHSSRFARS